MREVILIIHDHGTGRDPNVDMSEMYDPFETFDSIHSIPELKSEFSSYTINRKFQTKNLIIYSENVQHKPLAEKKTKQLKSQDIGANKKQI